MNLFSRKKKESKGTVVQTAQRKINSPLAMFSDVSSTAAERELFRNLRKSVPVIDAAICKLIRLLGTFTVTAKNSRCQQIIDDFMSNVCTNGTGTGINGFVYSYMESLLTYGEAVGEMVLSRDGKRVVALYNASVDDVEIQEGSSPLDLVICTKNDGMITPVKYSNLVFATLLNPEPGTVRGSSLLKGLPFVSSVLLKIFESIKTNWERVGNVRFAVTCKPSDNTVFTEDSARLIADEWSKAMRSESVCDFVSVGDVSVKVIGAENQIPDCDVPIKHLLEQIVHPRRELLLFLQRISEKQLEHGDQYELELRVIVVLIVIWYKDIGLQHMTGEFEVLLMQIDFDRRLRAGQIAKHRTWPDKCGSLIPQLV